MATFRFRLEKVLDWRKTRRDVEESKLRQLNKVLANTTAALQQLKVVRLKAELEARGLEHLQGRDLAALGTYRLRMEKREQELANDCETCRQKVQEQLNLWIEEKRRCQLLEKLKARRKAEF